MSEAGLGEGHGGTWDAGGREWNGEAGQGKGGERVVVGKGREGRGGEGKERG